MEHDKPEALFNFEEQAVAALLSMQTLSRLSLIVQAQPLGIQKPDPENVCTERDSLDCQL